RRRGPRWPRPSRPRAGSRRGRLRRRARDGAQPGGARSSGRAGCQAMGLPAPDPNATVVVTGASSGIGAELARELVRRGHHVTLVARRRDRLEALAGELERADVRTADLADAASRGELAGALRAAGRFVA